jgi:hypothetical protein
MHSVIRRAGLHRLATGRVARSLWPWHRGGVGADRRVVLGRQTQPLADHAPRPGVPSERPWDWVGRSTGVRDGWRGGALCAAQRVGARDVDLQAFRPVVSGGRGEAELSAVYDGRRPLAREPSGPGVYCGRWSVRIERRRVVGRDEIETEFRRVMPSVIEQACAKGIELDVMEAVAPLLVPGIGDDDDPEP